MITRKQITDAALEYVGRPFQAQGRGDSLDCLGLVLCVADDLGLKDVNGVPITRELYLNYPSQPGGRLVQDACSRHLIKTAYKLRQPGDVLTFALPSAPCHLGIVLDAERVVHAYAGGPQCCYILTINEKWMRRVASCFVFPGVQ